MSFDYYGEVEEIFNPFNIQGKKNYTIGQKTYTVNRYEYWENDETQVNFGIAVPGNKEVIAVRSTWDESTDNAQFPTQLEVKAALAIAKLYVLTPRDLAEQRVAELEQTQRWQKSAVNSALCRVADRERAIPTALRDAESALEQARRFQVKTEAELVQTEAALTAARAALANV